MTNADFTVHKTADVQTPNVGAGTTIWQYCVVLSGAVIGHDCNICSHTFIENDVVIGDRVTIKCGVQVWDGSRIESDVFIGPNVTFSNDPWPRSKVRPGAFSKTVVKKGASIGANATILPGITIGEGAMIGAGSVVTRSIPEQAVVVGNPARIVRYAQSVIMSGASGSQLSTKSEAGETSASTTVVNGVTIYNVRTIRDIRGNLVVGEFSKDIPFFPKRYFTIYDVPSKETRGAHAHHSCCEFLICVCGSCAVVVDDGEQRIEVALDDLHKGILIPPMVWRIMYKFSSDAVLLVFASDTYDPSDYIRNYTEFQAFVHGEGF